MIYGFSNLKDLLRLRQCRVEFLERTLSEATYQLSMLVVPSAPICRLTEHNEDKVQKRVSRLMGSAQGNGVYQCINSEAFEEVIRVQLGLGRLWKEKHQLRQPFPVREAVELVLQSISVNPDTEHQLVMSNSLVRKLLFQMKLHEEDLNINIGNWISDMASIEISVVFGIRRRMNTWNICCVCGVIQVFLDMVGVYAAVRRLVNRLRIQMPIRVCAAVRRLDDIVRESTNEIQFAPVHILHVLQCVSNLHHV